jgi:serine/threonine protein kinase/Tfp pilus assembly protein PilF
MASRDSLSGQTLGHYRIVEKIGCGGMGEVYRARDEHLDRQVAIKVLPPGTLSDESARKRFHKEAITLSRLNHPNIATIHDFDTQQGVDFLVMEYIPGITLSAKLATQPLPEKQVVALGSQLADGLSAAHEHGVVHCDLKPSNLRLTGDGRLKILDFGLAKLRLPVTATAATESLSETGTIAGTLPYMAPEQLLAGEIDARTDIYAAGAVLYEMATGQQLFADSDRSLLIGAILRRPPRPPTNLNPRLSPELERIIGKCLDKEPDNRYQSAKEIVADLRRMMTASSIVAVTRSPRAARSWRPLPIVLISGFVLFAFLSAFTVRRWRVAHVSQPAASTHISSLAVLPLDNLSADPAQEYFTDGMTEELISALAKISSLRVISRTSIMQYKGAHKSLPQIARELGVDGIVTGSVAQSADSRRVRITAELVEAASDHNLWSQSYERDLGDVFALQDDVARNISWQIRVQLTPKEQERLTHYRSVNSEAYTTYLKGRYHWNKGTEEELRLAKKYFEQATEIDHSYAPAYSGLADYYWVTDELAPRVAKPKARDYALKALALDGDLADAHTTFGAIQFYGDWDWTGAEKEFKHAIDLSPSRAEGHEMYSVFLSAMGRAPEAIAEIRTAQQLDPLAVDPSMIAGRTFYYARQYDSAIEQCRNALELDPNSIAAHDCLGEAYLGKRAYESAIAEFRVVASGSHNDPVRLAGLGRAYALAGKRIEAKAVLGKLRTASKVHYVPPYFFSMINAALGNKNQALSWLEKAHNEHDTYLARLRVDEAMDSLRSDQRFATLLQQMRLAP